jgi:hypothetical protein
MSANGVRELGALVEPISSHAWRVSGPFAEVRIKQADRGGWDTESGKSEHHATLQMALMRAYCLVMGFTRS